MGASKGHPLKLQIEMVPVPSWGKSLRNSIPKSRWNKIKEGVHDQNGRKCQICGSPNKLHCHELWEFGDRSKTQRLVGLGTVCHMCHHATHIGRSKQLASHGELDIEAVVKHFLKVNECTFATFSKHESEALAIWDGRSQHVWNIDFGAYASIVAEYAASRCPTSVIASSKRIIYIGETCDQSLFSLASLRGPIAITGSFKTPLVRPEVGGALARDGLAVALGAVTAGIGALVPLLDFGKDKNSNCTALMSHAKSDAGVKASDMAPRVGK
jgi:hypothetical protein